ncbi:MAG: MerR family transcriptional regulator [Pleurocapsa sp. MO_192.B19]|nr:MerR family transcriptional regulator [Pleurocapsa sp. MO_192.B19]
MRISELAKLAGVTPRTIRYYEDLGLLQASDRQGTGFRYYTEDELERLQKINLLKTLGLTLDEISSVIPLLFEEPRKLAGKQMLLDILKGHLQAIDQQVDSLTQLRTELQERIELIQQWIDRQASQK